MASLLHVSNTASISHCYFYAVLALDLKTQWFARKGPVLLNPHVQTKRKQASVPHRTCHSVSLSASSNTKHKQKAVIAMNEVIYQWTNHDNEKFLLSSVSAKYLLE